MRELCKPLQVMPSPIDGEFLAEVLDELDKIKQAAPSERRKFDRQSHRSMNVVLLVKEAGRERAFMVATRNISQGGASILHRQMVYAAQRCRLVFRLPDSKHLLVPSVIVCCRHVRGITHEIGVRFRRPISEDLLEEVLKQGEMIALTPR